MNLGRNRNIALYCIEGREFMFAVGCFFVFCGTAGGSCGEAGKWCGAGNIRLICFEIGIIYRVCKEDFRDLEMRNRFFFAN